MLQELYLVGNRIGDRGLVALAPALRQLERLEVLHMRYNEAGDVGLAALVAEPAQGWLGRPRLLQLLRVVDLSYNQITGAGCAHLAAALRDGALSALTDVDLRIEKDSRRGGIPTTHKQMYAARADLRCASTWVHDGHAFLAATY